MRKTGAILFLLLITMPILLFAQETEPPSEPEWDYYDDDLYSRGDQTFIITLGTAFPGIFRSNGKTIENKLSPPVGGAGSLIYNYYLTKEIFAGVEAGGMFIRTLGSNTLFLIPVGLRGGYQFNFKRFEFPLAAAFGMVWHRYLNQGYYGIYTKLGGSAFYRVTAAWSFGINANWFWLPQWTGDKDTTVHGNVLDLTLSARYHF